MRSHNNRSRGFAAVPLFFATGIAFALTFFFPLEVQASLIELTARPSTGNIVYWSTLGTPNLQFTTPQNFTSTGGITGTVNFNGNGGSLVEQCCVGITGTFDGDFAPGDIVVMSGPPGPLTIYFNTPVRTAGAQIQTNQIGDHFTAEIRAFNGSTLLGSFTENGFSGDVADNSNIFLGVQDATAEITSIEFRTFSTTDGGAAAAVAINQMTIDGPPPVDAYIANSGDGTVSVINTTTNTVVNTISVGRKPFGVAITPDGSKVYIANSGDNTVSVINTATNTVTGSPIAVGTDPVGVAVTPDGKTVYVTNQGDGTVSVISTATNTVIGSAIDVGCPIANCGRKTTNIPSGIAVTPDGSKVYVGNLGTPGYASVIATASNTVTTINTKKVTTGVAVTPNGSKVYFGSLNGVVLAIDAATNSVGHGSTIGVGSGSEGVAVTPDGSKVYVANSAVGTVSIINTGTNKVIGSVAVGSDPQGVSVASDGSKVYVANEGDGTVDGTVSIIDTATNTVETSTITVGKAPLAFGIFIQPQPTK